MLFLFFFGGGGSFLWAGWTSNRKNLCKVCGLRAVRSRARWIGHCLPSNHTEALLTLQGSRFGA